MCLSVPAKVLRIDGNMADVSVGGTVFKAGIHMVKDLNAGDYILLHAGFAIQKIDEAEAEETLRLLDEMNEAMNQ
jgi:hydrogenase expression/formation protein HypC